MVMLNIVKFDKNSDLLKKSKDLATLRPYQLCDNFGRVISTGSASIRLPDGSVVKPPPASAGDTRDTGLIPGSGRSLGGGNGHPLQYSCLENSVDKGAWQGTVHGAAKSRT